MPVYSEEEYMMHYGIRRRSGRYPWGSGANSATPEQRSKSFYDVMEVHKKQGMTEAEIAKAYSTKEHPFSVADLRATKAQASSIKKQEAIREATRLHEKGMSPSAIGKQMGKNESSVRSLLEPGRLEKEKETEAIANMLKKEVADKEYVDVGVHVEKDLPIGDNPATRIGISQDKFRNALYMLREEGYSVHLVKSPQVGTGEMTSYKVLVKPGVTQYDAFVNRGKIQLISQKTDDGGKTYNDEAILPPLYISPKRVEIVYKEQGGDKADGVIYVRPGVKDVSLGNKQYAQVRIAIKGNKYLKGMAVYKDDLPPGVDLQFHTNKSDTGNKMDAMKPMKPIDKEGNIDPVNPFGAMIKLGGQIKNKNGKVTSAMNKINEEGDWDKWSKTLSAQMLSKQSPELAKAQLDVTFKDRRDDFENIMALTNPRIKKKLLESFSDDADAAAVHMKAANMPKQATKVILPVQSMKPNEIYAPTFRPGERVVLIRFPHAGKFEIPELIVNNGNREAKRLFGIGKGGTAIDAVGIHPKVAEHLSGADFDGDHVVVIPNNLGKIKKDRPLEGLKNFDPQKYHVDLDPKTATPEHPDGIPIIKKARKETEMGMVTNLLSDMTVLGAPREEIVRAVRHSMVVIDSEKHNLDFRASERDNDIPKLKEKYQGKHPGGQLKGASTLITRATSEQRVANRKARLAGDGGPIDKATGRKVYTPTGEVNKRTGKPKTFKSKKLAETDDAFSLISDKQTTIERVYATHSNKLKALANEARLANEATKPKPYSPSAKNTYHKEVASLNAKLETAQKNAPLERQANLVANQIVALRKQANPNMDPADKKKIKGQALEEARLRTGAKKARIKIEDKEWDAIQQGAISDDKLQKILNNTDIKELRARATPRPNRVMTTALQRQAKLLLDRGFTLADVADRLGIAPSTIQSSVGEGGE